MISREDAIKGITATADEISKPKDHKIEAAEATRVEIDGRKEYFSLRKDWSRYIARWITGLIIFNALLSVGVGLEWLTFSNMEWFVTAVTIETFLQIVGMGYIAVKFLFSHT